jgi:DNA-binding NarL/FixJ family response regulator
MAKAIRLEENRRRVLLVDDHAVFRLGMAQLINREPDLIVCGEEEDAPSALTAIEGARPDLVIVDISLKESSGLDLLRSLRARSPKLPLLVVSTYDESLYAEAAFRAGALGYLMKSEAVEKVIPAIRRVLGGQVYVSEALAARMLQRQVCGQAEIGASPLAGLSGREREVLQMIGRWKKTGEIAAELHLSVKTIDYYRERLKHKLDLRNGAELAHYATSLVQGRNPPDGVFPLQGPIKIR